MRTVLIVEDSEACAETLQIALESLPDLKTVVLGSAAAALAALLREDADVAALVTDLHMPKNDGFDLIRRLRAEPRYARLPVLMISGDSDPRVPQRALEAGADAFFSKPYSPAAVRRKLEQLLC
jgi:CheY-like chemotaxis protein